MEAMAPDCLSTFISRMAPKMMALVSKEARKPATVRAAASPIPMPQTEHATAKAASHEMISDRLADQFIKTMKTIVSKIGTAAINAYMRVSLLSPCAPGSAGNKGRDEI